MKQDNTNANIDNAVLRAERAVENSINKFEAAMEHLAQRAEVTSQQIQHVREVGQRSKDQLMHLKDEVSSTLQPVRPYISQARTVSRRAVSGVSANSRPLLVSAIGLLGGYLFYRYFLRSRSVNSAVGTTYAEGSTGQFYTTGQSADQFANLSYPR